MPIPLTQTRLQANDPALRRERVLEHIRTQHPDLWAMSPEVDESLLDYLASLSPDERVRLGQQMAANVEAMRSARRIG